MVGVDCFGLWGEDKALSIPGRPADALGVQGPQVPVQVPQRERTELGLCGSCWWLGGQVGQLSSLVLCPVYCAE